MNEQEAEGDHSKKKIIDSCWGLSKVHLDKENVVHTYSGILLSHKKEK